MPYSARHDRRWLTARLGDAVLDGLLQQIQVDVPGVRLRVDHHRRRAQVRDRVRRCAEGETLHQHLVARLHACRQQAQMHRRRAGRERHHALPFTHEVFQILLEPIHIRSQGHHPVRIECLLDVLLFHTRLAHVGQAQVNAFSFRHNMF